MDEIATLALIENGFCLNAPGWRMKDEVLTIFDQSVTISAHGDGVGTRYFGHLGAPSPWREFMAMIFALISNGNMDDDLDRSEGMTIGPLTGDGTEIAKCIGNLT